MALVTEDGTGRADAESYISVADATAYHAGLGNTAWANVASDEEREQLLRRATGFMERRYRSRWAGMRLSVTQRLSWPRYEVPIKDAPGGYASLPSFYPFDKVPALVGEACALLALRAIDGALTDEPEVAVKRKKVGALEVEYFEGALPVRPMSAITEMLSPFFSGGGMNIQLVRA